MEKVFIGWDTREQEAYAVCRFSMERRASIPLAVKPLMVGPLRYRKLFYRKQKIEGRKRIDLQDGKPFSTDFAFTRFLIPYLCDYEGWALFCDCDILFLGDVAELFALRDDRYAVMCVKHEYAPTDTVKMDGQAQEIYRRKNWSSVVLWNCGHPSNQNIGLNEVNTETGAWLHSFSWLKDDEIGGLPIEWNWLEGHNPMSIDAKAVHFTRGGPWFQAWEDCDHAEDWLRERDLMDSQFNFNLRGYA